MNGRFLSPALPSFVPFVTLRPAMILDLYAKRFYAALAASCLLHAGFVLLPYLGGGAAGSRVAVQGVQKRGPVRVLTVRLVEGSASAATAAQFAAALAGAADPPAPRMADEEPLPAPVRELGAGLAPVTAPAYYTTDKLTAVPRPLSAPNLDLPAAAQNFESGKVILKVWVSEFGKVDLVSVEKSDVPEAISERAAAAFGKLRYIPGEINGRHVGSLMRIEVTYEDGVGTTP